MDFKRQSKERKDDYFDYVSVTTGLILGAALIYAINIGQGKVLVGGSEEGCKSSYVIKKRAPEILVAQRLSC